MKKIFRPTLLLLVCIFSNCEKREGPPGPQGPAGSPAKGYEFSVPLSSFVGPQLNKEWRYTFNPSTLLGESVIGEKDVVLLYIFLETSNGTDYYNAMPFLEYFYTTSSTSIFIQHSFQLSSLGTPNTIAIQIRHSAGIQPYSPMSTGSLKYKMVHIPAGAKSSKPNPDLNNYQEVKEAYNLTN